MASQRKILVLAPQIVDPNGTLILYPAPSAAMNPSPSTAPPQVVYYPVPFVPVPNPSYRGAVVVPRRPAVFAGPVRLRVDPAFLIRMDEQRTQELVQFMQSEGLVPSLEEEMKRRGVIEKLHEIVLAWIKNVALQHQLGVDVSASTSATILPYGSYGLGVHGSESDIDILCVAPCFATMEDDFFVGLRNMLQSRPEVSEVHCVKRAKVPLMRFKFNGIAVDFPYAQLQVITVPNNMDIFDPSLIADETSWRSLSGVHANTLIRQLVPNLGNFQSMLRCVKLWARRRGIYSHLLGFFGGIHLAILAAYVCQRHPNASISVLLSNFFDTFSHWPWPQPVILQDSSNSIQYKVPDARSLMPIMMPCFPFEWCSSNITESTFLKIHAEFQRAYMMIRDLGRLDFQWSRLFELYPYTKKHAYFLRIFLAASDGDELQDWVGWVKSRFRSLLLKLEAVQGYCDPNPTEYVDHTVSQPNTIFYWGLSSDRVGFVNINSVREDFMRSVDKDLDGESSTRNCCRLELSIVESSQLPKNVQADSEEVEGSKACWRAVDDIQMRKPVHPQLNPHYFMGYVAAVDRNHFSS